MHSHGSHRGAAGCNDGLQQTLSHTHTLPAFNLLSINYDVIGPSLSAVGRIQSQGLMNGSSNRDLIHIPAAPHLPAVRRVDRTHKPKSSHLSYYFAVCRVFVVVFLCVCVFFLPPCVKIAMQKNGTSRWANALYSQGPTTKCTPANVPPLRLVLNSH